MKWRVPVATQGVSEDGERATGDYETIERGEMSRDDLRALLARVEHLRTPPGEDNCPPAVHIAVAGEGVLNLHAEDGKLWCAQSRHGEMSVDEVINVAYGEMTIEAFDVEKGLPPERGYPVWLGPILVLAVGALIWFVVVRGN